ncbi:MAG: hypothetical protein MJA84_01465, partial [Firmicutes bacterium]|nr:hypothetical protein [Bacillota bacterium]
MYIPLLSLTALFGASQGLLLGIIVLSLQRGRPLANRLLACFLFAESLRLAMLMFTYGDWILPVDWLYLYLLLNVNYAIGPLLYGYTRAMTQPDFCLYRRHWLHLLPMVIAGLCCCVIFSQLQQQYADSSQFEQSAAYRWGIALSITGFVSLLIYAIRSLGLLKPYRAIITTQFSAIEQINLRWLKLLIVFCLATALISALVELTRLGTDLNLGPRILASLLMSVLMIYGIGIMGIRQPAIFGAGEWIVDDHRQAACDGAQNRDTPAAKYVKSGLNREASETLWHQLQTHMQRRQPYLENGLKLSELAEQMELLPNHLSQIINTHAGKS